MSVSSSCSETSSKGQENGVASSETERPLKKARFAWQVKGKHHLKSETNESVKTSSNEIQEVDLGEGPSTTSKDTQGEFVENTEQNLERLGDYLLNQDFNTLDSVMTDADQSSLTSLAIKITESQPFPRLKTSYEYYRYTILKQFDPNQILTPLSMHLYEDQCIARWQARQTAKGIVDNTINRVLDSWSHPPLPPVDNSQTIALDFADFINNLPVQNSIENEGILMAISAHGLQNNMMIEDSSSVSLGPNHKIKSFLSPPSGSSSPIHSDDEISKVQTDTVDESYENYRRLSSYRLLKNSDSEESFSENENLLTNSMNLNNDRNSSSNHSDFMDTAVSFAIQSKGLTAFGTDYG